MRSKFAWLVAVIALYIAGGRRADAETEQVNGVVAVGGNADERDRAAVGAAVTAATRVAGWQLPAKPLTKKEAAALLQCLEPGEPWACIPGTIDAQGIHHALVVAAQKQQADDGSPVVVLTAKLIVTQPRALVVQQRFCEHCTDDTLAKASTELTQQLVRELAVRVGRTVLQVRSVPTGARITLDGEPIGATDTTFNTYPGAHVVILEKPGYHSETVSINAEEGKTAEVSATMHPSSSGAASTASPPPPSRLIPLTLLGVGGVALVTGGVLVYLGQQDGPDDKTLHTHATTLGVVSGIAGIAAVGTGAYLWWRGNRTSAPVVTTVARGAMVGWAGTF